jgi:hypothetical protein
MNVYVLKIIILYVGVKLNLMPLGNTRVEHSCCGLLSYDNVTPSLVVP